MVGAKANWILAWTLLILFYCRASTGTTAQQRLEALESKLSKVDQLQAAVESMRMQMGILNELVLKISEVQKTCSQACPNKQPGQGDLTPGGSGNNGAESKEPCFYYHPSKTEVSSINIHRGQATYAPNMRCTTYITAPPGKTVKLTLLEMQMERDSRYTCKHDRLELWEGNTGVLLGKFCGRMLGTVETRGNRLKLVLVSDARGQYRGFRATYSVQDAKPGGGMPMASGPPAPVFCPDKVKGIRRIMVPGYPQPFNVFCDRGWIVIQRRQYPERLSFNRTWAQYKRGFGSVQSDHWLGLELLYQLTKQYSWKLKMNAFIDDYIDILGQRIPAPKEREVEYTNFKISSEATNYRLRVGQFKSKNNSLSNVFGCQLPDHFLDKLTGNALKNPLFQSLGIGTHMFGLTPRNPLHNNTRFATWDRSPGGSDCAKRYGGFWYAKCGSIFLNAPAKNMHYFDCTILKDLQVNPIRFITCYIQKITTQQRPCYVKSIKNTVMKIRPAN